MPRRRPSPPPADAPVRVAVIGGGCAALTAAFELTRPEHQGRYRVTVYQLGWRLGGKGASGRGVAGRIEEHGLHLWMGFYENAFGLMRECWEELPPRAGGRRFERWSDAFSPAPRVGVADGPEDSGWDFWLAHFPPGRGLPGDPPEQGSPFTVQAYLRQSAMLVAELVRSAGALEGERESSRAGLAEPPADTLGQRIDKLVGLGVLAGHAALLEAAEVLLQAVDRWMPEPARVGASPLLALLDALAAAVRRRLSRLVENDVALRRVWQVVDLILAALRGATFERLALDPRGFDALNDRDWREWLRTYGASEASLASGFMRAIYDLCFAYERGDPSRPRLAAGVAMRGAVRMFFTYRGALFWRMNAGMGDVVFAPLYEVLRRRGVRFEFFHRLRDVGVARAADGALPFVDRLDFDVQARPRGGRYEPLVDVARVPSWPAAPDWTQLEDGEALETEGRDFESHWDARRVGVESLRVGEHFDFVVLGVGVGAVPHVARQLLEASPAWRDMVERVETVPTQAFQVWLREDVDRLGWGRGAVNLSGFVEPFDTWADMRHVIPVEAWREPPAAIAYFCSVLPDETPAGGGSAAFEHAQFEKVRRTAVAFLDRHVGELWPGATRARGGFRWELLAAEGDGAPGRGGLRGRRRFDTQYWTANVNPSDRYVLSLPGSIRFRISPLARHFDNLTIAGDWTASGLDSGCIESAVMSGRLAAHALSREPPLCSIIGYDHP